MRMILAPERFTLEIFPRRTSRTTAPSGVWVKRTEPEMRKFAMEPGCFFAGRRQTRTTIARGPRQIQIGGYPFGAEKRFWKLTVENGHRGQAKPFEKAELFETGTRWSWTAATLSRAMCQELREH